VEEWGRFSDSLYLLGDNPALVHGMLELQGEFASALVDKILSQVQVDAALFSEPIGGAHGPLVSPRTYQEIVIRRYQPLLGILQKNGVDTIIMRTYANTQALLPSWVEAGFNCLWACECGPDAMNYAEIRAEYGSDLRLIGGIDTDWLYQETDTIRRRLFDVVPGLLQQGGYIPLADGRVRVEVPFENYVTYRELLQELVLDGKSS
jgi:uroporphyrinogen-III decarboxylase